MPRPRRNEHNREAILETGARLFSTRGYNGTGLKEILDAVNVPKGSFYNYFESKEHYAAEVIRHFVASLIQRFEEFVATSKEDPVAKIKITYNMIIDEMESFGCQQGCLMGNMAMEVAGESTLCRQALNEGLQRWKKNFVALLEQGQAQGLLRQDLTAQAMADVFWAAWEGSILRARIENNPQLMRDIVPLLLDQVLARSEG